MTSKQLKELSTRQEKEIETARKRVSKHLASGRYTYEQAKAVRKRINQIQKELIKIHAIPEMAQHQNFDCDVIITMYEGLSVKINLGKEGLSGIYAALREKELWWLVILDTIIW